APRFPIFRPQKTEQLRQEYRPKATRWTAVASPSIAQIERLIGELQQAKNLLGSERERIEREAVCYIKFAQMASDSAKFIFNTLMRRVWTRNRMSVPRPRLGAPSRSDACTLVLNGTHFPAHGYKRRLLCPSK